MVSVSGRGVGILQWVPGDGDKEGHQYLLFRKVIDLFVYNSVL